MASTMALFSFFMSACALCATSMHIPVEPDVANINWEDFDAAIGEEDCFGSNCGTASAALSMLQSRSPKTAAYEDRKAASLADSLRANVEETPAANDMPPMDDLADAFDLESEDHADMAALNLVQTGASIERVGTTDTAPMTVAAQADGSFEINPKAVSTPSDGSMTFSIDDHGSFHQEEGISLVQTEAHVEHKKAPAEIPEVQTESALKIRKLDLLADMELEDKETESLSLMQTDTSFAQKSMQSAVQADGSLEMNPKEQLVPSNGVMHFSLDGNGNFHSEDQEGFSLMQYDAQVTETITAGAIAAEAADDAEHPVWSAEASSEEAISLIQSDVSLHQSAVNADGSVGTHTDKPKVPKSGVMSLSVNGNGQFHYEI